jgi:hypothetical protein
MYAYIHDQTVQLGALERVREGLPWPLDLLHGLILHLEHGGLQGRSRLRDTHTKYILLRTIAPFMIIKEQIGSTFTFFVILLLPLEAVVRLLLLPLLLLLLIWLELLSIDLLFESDWVAVFICWVVVSLVIAEMGWMFALAGLTPPCRAIYTDSNMQATFMVIVCRLNLLHQRFNLPKIFYE